MYRIIIKDKFDSAHRLPNYNGKCRNLHGHTWQIEVEFIAEDRLVQEVGTEEGMIWDFKRLKEAVKNCLPDHLLLNEWMEKVPTAENIVSKMFYMLQNVTPLTVNKVRLWESPDCGVEYFLSKGEQNVEDK